MVKECGICHATLCPPYIKCAECLISKGIFHLQRNQVPTESEIEGSSTQELMQVNDESSPLLTHSTDNSTTSTPTAGQLEGMTICISCFRSGRTLGVHNASHDYEIIGDNFPIMLTSTWTAKEELKLLESIESCGLGNWYSIAQHLPGRSARECEKHYHSVFLSVDMMSSLSGFREMPSSGWRRCVPYKHVVSSLPPRPAELSAAYNEISGYMAARGDFVTEYDNYAEIIVNDIDFTKDTDIDSELGDAYTDLCLAVVDIYRYRVFERERRKRIIRDYGLLNPHATDMYFSVLLRWFNNETVDALRKCMRLLHPEQFLQYIEGLKVEMRLKSEIHKLSDARREGLTSLHQVRIHEKLSVRRAETKRKCTALSSCLQNIQNEETWVRYIAKSSIADKIGTGAPLPHPALGRKRPGPLEIHSLPGYEKLNAEEKELCSVARLVPSAYLDFRKLLVNECRKEGHLRLARARTLIKIDVNKTRRIYDFLLKHNVINQEPL